MTLTGFRHLNSKGDYMNDRKCTVCGRMYTPTAYNQVRCTDCARARKMRCNVCGAVYVSSRHNRPGNRTRCDKCLSAFRSKLNSRAARPQSDKARARAFANRQAAGAQNIKHAIDACKTNPRTAKNSPEHAHAKIWHLQARDGNVYEVKNLNAFLRNNPDLFPNFNAAKCMFERMARSLREPDGQFKHAYSYMGWRIVCPPITPDDVLQRREYAEKIEKNREALKQK